MTVYYSLPKRSISNNQRRLDDSSTWEKKSPSAPANERSKSKIGTICFYSCLIFAVIFTILAFCLAVCSVLQENCDLMNCFYSSKSNQVGKSTTELRRLSDDDIETQIPPPPPFLSGLVSPKFPLVRILTKPLPSDESLSKSTQAVPPTVAPLVFDAPNPESKSESDLSMQGIPPTVAPVVFETPNPVSESESDLSTQAVPSTVARMVFVAPNPETESSESESESESDLLDFIAKMPLVRWFFMDSSDSGDSFEK